VKKYQIIVYGAYGYTGEIIVEELQSKNLSVLLSGRSESKLIELSQKTGFPYITVNLNDKDALLNLALQGKVMIHAAGPFKQTAGIMVEACIAAKTHYLDINGDISVFEMLKPYGDQAEKAGIMLLPGTGFDVVPTDCIAMHLNNQMSDAVSIKIAFATLGGGISHGTASTVITRLGEPAQRRENGKLVSIPLGKNGIMVKFGDKSMFCMSIPWGDVSTAYTSTGIPNIESFMAVKPSVYKLLKLQGIVNWLLRTNMVRRLIQKKIDTKPKGPNREQRDKGGALVWAQVENLKGETLSACIQTPESYNLTAKATVLIAEKIINNQFKSGYQTPAKAYGENLIFEMDGVRKILWRS
jgi:short subunit dehydrogenase-like uncharacterized protein